MVGDWLLPTLAILPVMIGVLLAVGVPWALVVLPRQDWADRVMVGTVGLALGAMGLTTAMFLLGTFGTITLAGSLLSGAVLALTGAAAARWRARREPLPEERGGPGFPLANWERLILAGLLVGLILRVIRVAYWPFAAYDALWVYGYNARVFTLSGQIPASMDYYPQLLPLLYTFGQMLWGGINDHAARAAIPIMALGSFGAAYLLGARLAGRRAGLLTAALWAFFPPHVDWSRFGDLEVPLTFYFTLAALFMLLAWRAEGGRAWRYAAAAGLMLAGGMWTKPTAGALVWGFGLLWLLDIARSRLDRARLWRNFRLIAVAGVFSAPIGGMWYIRNLLLGHPALVFPPAYWLTQAQRSGRQLTLPLIALTVLAAILLLSREGPRVSRRLLIPGLLLMIGGALPSAGLGGLPTHRLTLPEIGLLLVGLALYTAGVIRWWRDGGGALADRGALAQAAEVLALLLPYWVTWFWSYSYHPRLAFAITVLQLFLIARLLLALAARLAGRLTPARGRALASAALLALIVPGLVGTMSDVVPYWIEGRLQTDDDKQLASNYALMRTVNVLRQEIAASERPVKIVAPGNLRLPFFFPDLPVITDPVTDLHVLDDGVTHFIDGFEAQNAYNASGQGVNPVRGAMGLPRLAQLLAHEWDGDFYYDIYRVDTAARFSEPEYNGVLPERVVYPGFAEVLGFAVTGRDFWPGRRIVLNIYFHVLGRVDTDYTIYLHVTDGERLLATWDHMPGQNKYVTSLWEPGEYIEDQLWVELGDDVPVGTYSVVMGLYNYETGERLPVQVGNETTDGFVLIDMIRKLAGPPG